MRSILLNIILGALLLTACTPKSEQAILAQKEEYRSDPETPTKEIIQGPSENKSSDPEDLSSLFKKHRSAVFMILTSNGAEGFQGSGFFVSQDGIGVSNYHVFEGTTIGFEEIVLIDGTRYKIGQVLQKSQENDFIVFKVSSASSLNYLNVASTLPEVGEDVFSIGNPRGLEHTLSTGIVSGYRDDNKYIQTTTEITHGSSGGPLLNMRGDVIGITTSGLGEANLNFAVNIKVLNIDQYLKTKG